MPPSGGETVKAREIMNQPVLGAAKTAMARDVAIRMLSGGFSGMPITERDGSVVGIVSELDLIRALRAGKPLETTTAAEIMTTEVVGVDIDAPVEEVMEILDTKHIVRLPVVENGKLVGVISRPDVLRAAIESKFMRFS
jgi:CBS domain-containing protein